MTAQRLGWIDATAGVSGDMLLGACLDAGVELAVVQEALDKLDLPEEVTVATNRVQRGGLGAAQAVVDAPHSEHRRTLLDIVALLRPLPDAPRERATAVFRALADAEARVHQVPPDAVHFHEVGALDSIADVVGVVVALDALRIERLVCTPIALGGGRAHTEHGPVPVPGPAVVELLRAHNAPGFGGPIATELATPTGVALVTVLADEFGPLPAVRPAYVGVGAGSKDPAGHPNIVRLVVGPSLPDAAGQLPSAPAVVLEANVDDLDPRLWPQVLADLLSAGASDAWLTPIVMKKGRPAHTLCVLADPDRVAALERVVLTTTSTIGLRRRAVDKVALPRESLTVDVFGSPVRVKLARLDGEVVNAVPEFDDIARVAAEQSLPPKVVLNAARAAVEQQLGLRG